LQLSAQTNLKNISVLRFVAQNVPPVEAEIVTDLLTVALVSSKQYSMVDRANMDKILKEQSFQQTGCTDSECAVEIGRLLNMDYMITGTLAKLDNSYFITVSIVDVETSRIEQSFKSPGFVMKNVEEVIGDVSDQIITEFAPITIARNKNEIERQSGWQVKRLKKIRKQRELTAQKAAEAEAKRLADEQKKQELVLPKSDELKGKVKCQKTPGNAARKAAQQFKKGNYAEAVRLYDCAASAAKKPERRAAAWIGAAWAGYQNREYSVSMTYLGRITNTDVSAAFKAAAFSLMGKCLIAINADSEAAECLAMAFKEEPKGMLAPWTELLKAQAEIKTGSNIAAQSTLRQLTQLFPESPAALIGRETLARLYATSRNIRGALREYELILEKSPETSQGDRARIFLGDSAEMDGDMTRAVQLWTSVYKRNTAVQSLEYFEAVFRLAGFYKASGETEKETIFSEKLQTPHRNNNFASLSM